MQQCLKNISDDRLRAYIIWLPMQPLDNRTAAEKRSAEFADKRLNYFWDGDRITAKAWQEVLGLEFLAWDVYLLYDAGARWEKDATAPHFWMHQLGKVTKAPRLDGSKFEIKARELLSKINPPK